MAMTSTLIQISKSSYFDDTLLIDSNIPPEVTVTVPVASIPYGVPLYLRSRYTDDTIDDSSWCHTVQFTMRPPAEVIGICMYGTGNRVGDFRRIDAAGNFISTFDYHTHPIYTQKMRDVIIDGCSMKEIDTLYIKTAVSGPVGSDASGKKCWWVATDQYDATWHPVAAFKRDGKVSPKIWIGSYLGHTDNGKLGSANNQTVASSKTKADYRSLINARNINGVSGFRMFDIWDLSLIRMLLLILGGGSDTQAIFGDNSANVAFPKSGATGATALGLHDLWKCYWYHVDKIQTSNNTVTLTDPYNGTTLTPIGTLPATNGWITDVIDGDIIIAGDTHNLMELFLPRTIHGSESNGTFADYYSKDSDPDVLTGRPFGYTEEYQNYEQTGTTAVSYWSQFNSSCGQRSKVASKVISYYAQYGSSCPSYSQQSAMPDETKCPYHLGYTMRVACVSCGRVAGASSYGWCSNSSKGVYPNCIYPCKYTMPTARCTSYSCSIYESTGGTQYMCSRSGSSCATSSCPYTFDTIASYYKCSWLGSECRTSSCGYTYANNPIMGYVTRTRTVTFDKQSGIFSTGIGMPFPARNQALFSARLAKS